MMRTETTTRTIYTFDELSDAAKEKARDWYREGIAGDSYWHEWIIEYAKTIGAILGIDIDDVYFSGFWSQGDGASFTGRYKYRKGWRKALRDHVGGNSLPALERIGEALQAAQKSTMYSGTARISTSGRYCHAWTMRFDCDVEYGNYGDFELTLSEALRDYANWTYRQLESEYYYQNSDEVVDESIKSIEYEFDKSGGIA